MPITSLACTSRQARTHKPQLMQASRLTEMAEWRGVSSGSVGGWQAARRRHAHCCNPVPELRLVVVGVGGLRLIGDQQLEHHFAAFAGAFGRGLDLHAGRRRADAGGGEHAFALDLDHAGAAVTVGAIARCIVPAQMRDGRAGALGDLPDGLALGRLDRFAVELERDFTHLKSSGKYLITHLTGFGAACPKPQIEASLITWARSPSRSISHDGALISLTAFSVPLRQGVH